MLLETPSLAITEGEAQAYGRAWGNVLRHYSITASQKAIDIATLMGLTGVLYVPRGIALSRRLKQGKPSQQTRRTAPMGQVFQFHTPNAAPADGLMADAPPEPEPMH